MATAAPLAPAVQVAPPPPPFVTMEIYLTTVYETDVDYVDGELEERNMGELEHSALQGRLYLILCGLGESWEQRVRIEARVQTSPTRFRVPDVCVMPEGWNESRIIRTAPLLCVEILSPEDRMQRVLAKTSEYLELGTQEVWLVDPATRKILQIDARTSTEHASGSIQLAGTPLNFHLDRLFSALDRRSASI